MKTLLKTFLALGLLFLQVVPVFAQGTILPAPQKDVDCNQILNDFEINPVIPNDSAIAAADKYNKAKTTLDSAKKEYEQAKAAEDAALKEYQDAGCVGDGKYAPGKAATCSQLFDKVAPGGTGTLSSKTSSAKSFLDEAQSNFDIANNNGVNLQDTDVEKLKGKKDNLLGCAIKTGRITLSMIPYFITYIINFALGLVGLVSVLFIVLGGYYYVFGGLTEEKDKGKKTIVHALEGMALALMAWTIVNVIMAAVTG